MSHDVKGVRVLITGGADGIGLGIARSFVRAGAAVHVCDASAAAVESVAKSDPAISAHSADVTKFEELETFVTMAHAAMGGIDVMINNVGISGPHAAVENITPEDWDITMRANVTSMFYGVKLVAPEMKLRKSGVILNTSSVGSFTLPPNRSVYNTSKWAVEGMTRSLSRELGPFNVRCNAILPGIVNNSRMKRIMQRRADAEDRHIDEVREEYLNSSSMHTLIEVEDIGEMAVFLASPRARFVTGQLISVCGGINWEN